MDGALSWLGDSRFRTFSWPSSHVLDHTLLWLMPLWSFLFRSRKETPTAPPAIRTTANAINETTSPALLFFWGGARQCPEAFCGERVQVRNVSRATRVLANSLGSCRWQGRHVRGVARIEVSVRSRRPLRHCHALCAYATAVQPGSGVEQKSWVPRLGTSGGQGRGRTGDLSLFRRTLLPTELPGRWVACSSPSDPDGTRTRDLRRDRAAR